MGNQHPPLPYNPQELPRELKKFYISAEHEEIQSMLHETGKKNISEIFDDIPNEVKMTSPPDIAPYLEYDQLAQHLYDVSKMNNIKPSFIGDGLKTFKVPPIVSKVCDIRGLTTAYTPYQPERSQGTLYTLWLYSSCLRMLTGFEAINASFYDRATCLYEAIQTGLRLHRKGKTALIFGNIYPGDIEVLHTQAKETKLNIVVIPAPKEGVISKELLNEWIEKTGNDVAVVAFPQVNNFGLLEDVDGLTDLCQEKSIQSIAMIDPMLLGSEGLKAPSEFGTNAQGVNMIVGEGQQLCLGPNFGGPGLGIFGIRFNDKNKNAIRSTAGRFIGKTKDAKGNDCLTMVLSTREQHIRREKAMSNICSNQSFVASIAGAAILDRGEQGMKQAHLSARKNALECFTQLTKHQGVTHAFSTEFYNEFTLELDSSVDELIKKATQAGLHLGVNVSNRIEGDHQLLLLSFFDTQSKQDIQELLTFFDSNFEKQSDGDQAPAIPSEKLRSKPVGLPQINHKDLFKYYQDLGDLNVSPDDNVYPLGSCTMKYNPYINDWAASLPGITDLHPQAPLEDAQGALFVLYQTQEIFKGITGMPAIATQPLSGAQGELVGIKMFQAYHADKGEGENRNIIIIPKSAHGTNPATATMAGFETKKVNGISYGIVTIDASEHGQIIISQVKEVIAQNPGRIAGIMVTNPNTSGIFETQFKEMAQLIHEAGGLVYMDGANMNAIAGHININELGVDALHNNLHKTWTIPHGGGGPGDAIVAVSERLKDYIPGIQVEKREGRYFSVTPSKTIGSFHRHFGNFAHKVRCYAYLRALGGEGVQQMANIAVLSAQYLFEKLKTTYPTLPLNSQSVHRMHEFILTITPETFDKIQAAGTKKNDAIAKIGKLFLDFGIHSPTVAFPEQFGLMIEPTESFTKDELDRFIDVIKTMKSLIEDTPEILTTVPHFTPVRKVDEVAANKNLILSQELDNLPSIPSNPFCTEEFNKMSISDIAQKIIIAHQED